MTLADEARANSISCEMVKYAYRQTKDGVVVSFVVHPNDVPAALSTSHIGSRYMAVLVQIGDDERPIPLKEKEQAKPETVSPATPRRLDKPAGAKRDWREVDPTTQAGIRCNEPVFIKFLEERYAGTWREVQDAAEIVRAICGVKSRKAFNTDHRARVCWHQLDEQFQAWKALEHA